MEKRIVAKPCARISLSYKKEQATDADGWISRGLRQVKDARHKGLNIVQSYLYDILEKANVMVKESKSMLLGWQAGEGMECKGARGDFLRG